MAGRIVLVHQYPVCRPFQVIELPGANRPQKGPDNWLYGGSKQKIMESIDKGRSGRMPAHAEFLGEAKAHLLAAYVYSLSHPVAGGRTEK